LSGWLRARLLGLGQFLLERGDLLTLQFHQRLELPYLGIPWIFNRTRDQYQDHHQCLHHVVLSHCPDTSILALLLCSEILL